MNMRWMIGVALLGPIVGCGAESGSAGEGDLSVAVDPQVLSVGDEGDAVEVVYDYLHFYGYLQNDALTELDPAWRPVSGAQPTNPRVFDAEMEEAVFALQRSMGLPTTGVVDEQTRALMEQSRCGNPDGHTHLDEDEKYSLSSGKWANGRNITWNLVNTNGYPRSLVETHISAAFTSWSKRTKLTFAKDTSGAANVTIRFASIDGAGGTGAKAVRNPSSGIATSATITLDSAENWSGATPTAPSQLDFQTVMLHEIGHMLGLGHSSVGGATMYPTFDYGAQDRTLSQDDNEAIWASYDSWVQVAGEPMADLDASPGPSSLIWAITTSGGIRRYNPGLPGGFEFADGYAARVAVDPSGVPWVTVPQGEIWRRNNSLAGTQSWTRIAGCAYDVAVGANGDVWIVGCDTLSTGNGYRVYKWNGSGWTAPTAQPGAVRVAVDRNGQVYAVDNVGKIRFASGDPRTMPWLGFGSTAPCARDIAVAGNASPNAISVPWIIGCGSAGGGYKIYGGNFQGSVVDGGGSAPSMSAWHLLPGGGTNIAVDSAGRPWVLNSAGEIYKAK